MIRLPAIRVMRLLLSIVMGVIVAGCVGTNPTQPVQTLPAPTQEPSAVATATVTAASRPTELAPATATENASASSLVLVDMKNRLWPGEFQAAMLSPDGMVLRFRDSFGDWYAYRVDTGVLAPTDGPPIRIPMSEEEWETLDAVAVWDLARQFDAAQQVSPVSSMLLYVRNAAPTPMIAVYNLHQKRITNLGPSPDGLCQAVGNLEPIWTPDSRKAVFHCGLPDTLAVADLGPIRVIETEATITDQYYGVSMSPTGEYFAFMTADEVPVVSILSMRDYSVREIAPGGVAPSWSADGQRLFYTRTLSSEPYDRLTCAIYVYDFETEQERLFVDPAELDGVSIGCYSPLVVSADESTVGFVSTGTAERDAGYYLYRRDIP